MKKVLLIKASPRAGWSDRAAVTLAEMLGEKDVEVRTVALRDLAIGQCRGCGVCFGKGAKFCPMSEDAAQKLLSEMIWADGVVFVLPNYAMQVPGLLKNLIDRLSFVFHRPRLFGRVFMAVIAQGIYGGKEVHKYLNKTMEFWGFRPVKGAVVQGALYPNDTLSAEAERKTVEKLRKASGRFVKTLNSGKPKTPSFFRVAIYRSTRTAMQYFEDVLAPDRAHYQKNGWFDAPYYYKVAQGPFKRAFGALIDVSVRRSAKKNKKKILE